MRISDWSSDVCSSDLDIRARVEKKEVVIGFGHPVYTVADPRNKVIKEVARELSAEQGNMKMYDIAERLENIMWDKIGRAEWRERVGQDVEISGVAVSLKKKK